ncbi:DUF2851 family protein [uncultured Rikenella sp.]|uniref:DUF2851 family protein n=1 Tax=uncultured Rikenella sp. TaxID=368003 RepID=UPI0025D184E1|nr:DUF2851 family protein [uncultured Rikenella sp.]
MTENQKRGLLALVWGHRLFRDDQLTLSAADGEPMVEHPGYAPEPAAEADTPLPDFVQAAVRVGPTTLYGAVRVDSRASQWRDEGRMTDPAFDGVAFHVVGDRDRILVRGGREVTTLVLQPSEELNGWYADSLETAAAGGGGVCAEFFGRLAGVEQGQIVSRLLADRLRRKTAEIERLRTAVGGDWDETAYVCYLRSLGMGDQKRSYEALARSIPLRCFVRCGGDVRQAEALLLGQSGYLNGVFEADPAVRQWQDIYLSLKKEYGLRRPVVSWAGAGVRPVSLPSTMLLRAAALLARETQLSERVREAAQQGMPALRELFGEARAGMSAQKVDLRIINFVIPLLTALGRANRDTGLQERALALYDEVAPESNRYTRAWSSVFTPRSASDSQALIQLSTEYCARSRCAECPVGVLRAVRLWRGLNGSGR